MEFSQLIIIAILVEAIWENLKMIWESNKISINRIGSIVLSILVCCLAQVDIFLIVGIQFALPIFGWILTGVICSRGANFVNDLFSKLRSE